MMFLMISHLEVDLNTPLILRYYRTPQKQLETIFYLVIRGMRHRETHNFFQMTVYCHHNQVLPGFFHQPKVYVYYC